MRIAFDHSIFNIQSFGGVSRYYARLAKHLHSATDQVKIFAPLHINHYLDEIPDELIYGKRVKRYPKLLKKMARQTNFHLAQHAISKWKPDILHETFFTETPIKAGKAAVVVTIYDMITELMPEQFHNAELSSLRKKQAVERADHVICISNQTRDDLCKIFGTPMEKISVIYPGVDRFPSPSKSDLGIHKPFFLFVGNRSGYKNFEALLHTVATSRHIINNFSIVAFGGGEFSVQEKHKINELGLKPENVLHRKGSDELLANYYVNAHAFIYPSKYEGFGFPPLEAMAMGCPVICSNTSCIPEIVGNSALTFNPYKIEELASAMETMIFKGQDRLEFKTKGFERQKKFTWEKTASEMKFIYNTLRSQ